MSPANVIPLRPAAASLGERSDDELMMLASAGMSAAFATLAARHMKRLVHFAAHLVGDRRTAEEVAQEVWLHVWAQRSAYAPQGKFIVFLLTAARNRCRNHARDTVRRGAWMVTPSLSSELDAAIKPEQLDGLLERERNRIVHEALGKLADKLREALILRFAEELSYEDIAAMLGANESTVRSRVHHGLKELRTNLERQHAR